MSDLQVNIERMISLRVNNFPSLLTGSSSTKPNAVEPGEQVTATLAKKENQNAEKRFEQVSEGSRSTKASSNLYPQVFQSLTLMNQFKTWTIGRKLKGKIKKIASRSTSNSSADQDHHQLPSDVQQPHVWSDQHSSSCSSSDTPNSSSMSDDKDDSASSDLASGTDSAHGSAIESPPWLLPPCAPASNFVTSNCNTSSPTDLEKAIESLSTDSLDKIEIIAVSLTKDVRGELGIYVKGKLDSKGTLGYVIADFEANGPAEK